VNSSGQVIGIITASARGQFDVQQPSGIGFAIPVNRALGIVRQIRSGRGGSSIVIGEPGFIGVQVRDLDAATVSQLGLSVHSGALVVSVVPGTPAAGAGITAGSVITAVDGARIASADALGPALHSHRPGDRVTLTWVDANGTHSTAVHLVSGPAV
jgi:S1-C subfamily serine protease